MDLIVLFILQMLQVVKRVNGFHLKRCPDDLLDLDGDVEKSRGGNEVKEKPHDDQEDNGIEVCCNINIIEYMCLYHKYVHLI